MRAVFAIPGDLTTPTGGYAYARRLIREAPGQALALEPLALAEPVSADARLGAIERLAAVPPDRVILIDGLALGHLPAGALGTIQAPMVALCHHPLALETGLTEAEAADLSQSETRALAACAHVITTSHATAGILCAEFGVPGARVTVAPPGTDPAPRAAGSGKPGCRILSVGSLTPRKGHDRLVRGLERIATADWTARIVGPPRDPATAEALTLQIARAGLDQRIELTGPMPLGRLTTAYQTADLFVLASRYEGFGMAFAEAMSHGLPVLGLTSAAVEEATAGAACLVAPEAFDAALARLVTDGAARAGLADRCWTAAQTLHRWSGTAAIVARVLKAVAP